MNTKLQINLSTRIHPETQKVLEYSVLANVAANSVSELADLYHQIRMVVGKEITINGLPQASVVAPAQLPTSRVQEPELGNCPHCTAPLARITCRKQNSKNFGKTYAVCPRHRTTGCSYIVELQS